MNLIPIAHIHTDFKEKFGTPRQSRLVKDAVGHVVFTPEFRIPEAIRGIDGYSHLWLIWGFSLNRPVPFHPTVRPPRLGGNERVGVFATRSPYRPNPVGLSAVRLTAVRMTEQGPVLDVSGVDMVDGTPIYDIKPYIPYADAVAGASGGFVDLRERQLLSVSLSPEIQVPGELDEWKTLLNVLAQDPRPAYEHDASKIYGLSFGPFNVRFRVDDTAHCLTVVSVQML